MMAHEVEDEESEANSERSDKAEESNEKQEDLLLLLRLRRGDAEPERKRRHELMDHNEILAAT